jgi:hypothetical protein
VKAYGGVDVSIHLFLSSTLVELKGRLHAPAALPSVKKAPGTHLMGGWVGLRVGLDDVERRKFLILPGLELRPLGRPARSQSLYRLRHPGSWCPLVNSTNPEKLL